MKSYKQITYVIFIGLIGLSASGQSIRETVKGNNSFAFEIFKEAFDANSNVFLSPYSISSALAMTYAGARNETERQMSKVLHYDLNQINTHKGFLAIDSKLEKFRNDSEIKLRVANAIWKDEAWFFKKDYLELTKKYYKASIFPLTNAKAINDWVKKETNDKIEDLVTDDDLVLARMVLTNSIYFKGDWLVSFNKKDTKKGKFKTVDNKAVHVDFMFQKSEVNYFEDEQNQVIELPYKGELMSMIVILPKSENSIIELVNKINYKLVENYMLNFKREKVNINIPKFSFRSEFELSRTLTKMGMPDAFNPNKADFTAMSSGLSISKVKHQSFIEVNEKGSEAAAATAVTMIEKNAALKKEKLFKADRPFMFLIRDNQTGSILFVGSILNPSQ